MTDNSRKLLDNLDHYLNDVIFDLVDENETLEGQVNELREQVARLTENKGEMSDLISRKSLLNKINAYVVGSQDKEFICKLIKEMPSVEPIDVQEAYYKGKIDGIKECTAKLRKMNEELANE